MGICFYAKAADFGEFSAAVLKFFVLMVFVKEVSAFDVHSVQVRYQLIMLIRHVMMLHADVIKQVEHEVPEVEVNVIVPVVVRLLTMLLWYWYVSV